TLLLATTMACRATSAPHVVVTGVDAQAADSTNVTPARVAPISGDRSVVASPGPKLMTATAGSRACVPIQRTALAIAAALPVPSQYARRANSVARLATPEPSPAARLA